jgi:signal peptidase
VEVQNTEGQLSFITKGDNNEYVDASPVNPDRIIGKVRFTIPQLGYLITYVQQPPGTYITISVVAVLLLLTILPDIIFPEEKKSNKQEETK